MAEEFFPTGNKLPIDMTESSLLICYEEIIKQPGLYIVEQIRKNPPESFKDYIDLETLQEVSDKDLPFLYNIRSHYNPLRWLATSTFDWDKEYEKLYNRDKLMYISSPYTDFHEGVEQYLKAFFISKIYFWSRYYDKRIDFDIQSEYNNRDHSDKVEYITGPLDATIDELEVDMVFYPELNDSIWELIRENRNIVFAFPSHPFNMANEDTLIGQTSKDENVGFFPCTKPHVLG